MNEAGSRSYVCHSKFVQRHEWNRHLEFLRDLPIWDKYDRVSVLSILLDDFQDKEWAVKLLFQSLRGNYGNQVWPDDWEKRFLQYCSIPSGLRSDLCTSSTMSVAQ